MAKRKAAPTKCGFCGRGANRVRILLAGKSKGSFICDVCILLAMHALVHEFTTEKRHGQ